MNSVGRAPAPHRTRCRSDVAADAREHRGAARGRVEPREVEPELGGVAAQVVVLERLLAVEEHLVHLPEPVLERRRLGRGGRGERVRVDLGQREVPEREADALAQLASTRSISRNARREYGHS